MTKKNKCLTAPDRLSVRFPQKNLGSPNICWRVKTGERRRKLRYLFQLLNYLIHHIPRPARDQIVTDFVR